MTGYIYRKSYKTRRKKNIVHNRFFWIVGLSAILVAAFFYFLFLSSFFQIKKIEVGGNQRVEKEKIVDFVFNQTSGRAFFIFPKNIFFFKLKELDQLILDEFPLIGEVVLRKKFPSALAINVKERNSVGFWCKNDDCYNLDKEGIIFEKSAGEAKLIIKSGKEAAVGEKVIKKSYLASILKIKEEIARKIEAEIEEVFISDEEGEIIVRTSEGWDIYFDMKQDISSQIFNLDLVVEEKIPPEKRGNLEYIDLKFGSRVYFKYRD